MPDTASARRARQPWSLPRRWWRRGPQRCAAAGAAPVRGGRGRASHRSVGGRGGRGCRAVGCAPVLADQSNSARAGSPPRRGRVARAVGSSAVAPARRGHSKPAASPAGRWRRPRLAPCGEALGRRGGGARRVLPAEVVVPLVVELAGPCDPPPRARAAAPRRRRRRASRPSARSPAARPRAGGARAGSRSAPPRRARARGTTTTPSDPWWQRPWRVGTPRSGRWTEDDGKRSHYRDLVPESAPKQSGDVEKSAPVPGPPPNDRSCSSSAFAPSACSTARPGSTRSSSRPAADQVGVLVEALSSGLQAGGHVIAIAPDWAGPAAAERLQMARSMLDTHRIAVHETALPPLAATVLASLVLGLRRARAVRRRARVAAARARGRAARHHVAGQRGRPVDAHPVVRPAPREPHARQRVRRQLVSGARPCTGIGGSRAAVPLPRLERPSRLVVAPRDGDVAWLRDVVNPALGGSRRARSSRRRRQKWWGTGKLVEAVAYPVDVERLTEELTAALDPWVCRWCRELIARSPCPLCGHRGRPARRGGRPQQQRAARPSTAPPATSWSRRRDRRRRPRSGRGRRNGPAGTRPASRAGSSPAR